MICFPLDNTPYEAKDMGTYLATRTRGVFSAESNLTVTPGENGLSVSVSPGLAWLKWSDYWGTAALQEQALTLALDTADGALKRIDAIVCRLDKVNNRAEIVVKKGAPSSAPIVVPPVRDANYDELYIATVLIGAGVISISASAITDQRLNEEYCGLMRDGVTGIPTASLHAQAQQILTELTDALNAQIVRQSAEFDAWFDDLKGKLGEDPATALQLQVDNLNAAVVGDAFQASGAPVSIAYAGANRIASITAYGENAQGGTMEAPVALTGVDSVQVCGKNMLPNKAKTNTVAGITYTVNPDKSVTAKGTATSWSNIVIDADFSLPAGTYTLNSNIQTADVNLVIGKDTSGKKNIAVSATASKTFTLSDSIKHCVAYIAVAPDSVVDTTIRPMLNLGKTAMPYEPYKGSVTPIPIPRPLRRVGDVKDKCVTRQKHEGAEKLVVTYNVGYIASYAGESITTAWISSTGALSTGAEVAYVLSSPEVYATDPLDIDNAAGPLTVMTGGELEVRMTELVGSRTYDADGDGVVDRANSVDGGTY
nr:MAG TPA: Receptor Binding Protein [Caudoviricetes sp.]